MKDADAPSSTQQRLSGPAGGPSSGTAWQRRSSSLDDYEIIREIGRGGTAIVYEAYHKSLRRTVALKQQPAAAVLDPRWQERFHRELDLPGGTTDIDAALTELWGARNSDPAEWRDGLDEAIVEISSCARALRH